MVGRSAVTPTLGTPTPAGALRRDRHPMSHLSPTARALGGSCSRTRADWMRSCSPAPRTGRTQRLTPPAWRAPERGVGRCHGLCVPCANVVLAAIQLKMWWTTKYPCIPCKTAINTYRWEPIISSYLQSTPPAHRARRTLTRGRCQQRPWLSQLAAPTLRRV